MAHLCLEFHLLETGKQFDGDIQYLVQSGNELLLVNRFLDLQYDLNIVGDYSNIVYRTVGFQVFKMDRSCPEWRQIMNLDNQVLFLGENSSLSLSASDFPGCLGNCIYYTDDYSEFNYAGAFGKHDLGIFRLCDASIEPLPCYPLNSYAQLGWPPPLWITPNPC
ncbi:F-box protein SKIP23-like [Quillaja saponaria]|uniref:F-box protein SKIP23-like n=1 Tax=Quillaja saponaria TaxID=32244 RepID=A0AAD7M1B9_QUISA|nr:F-box protein SKIP23-like [Quillaja saponaria]